MSAPVLSSSDRSAGLDALERERFDCVVIGGGITGAGVAREAARRGLSVALLEACDFASGTSSRSSKLIHGGLRYLALGDVALVRETALERKHVHRLAPHLAEPRWMLVPARSRAALLKFRAGLGTYETLGAVAEADRHRNWNAEELARREPLLRRDRTPWACVYREYLTDDARLVLANLRDAAAAGARALSYAPVEAVLVEGGRACGVEARCAESGRRIRVRAGVVVNAAGPWVEALRRLEAPGAAPLLHLSKGVHVGLPAACLPIRHIAILGAADRRSIFAIPRGEVVYLGTTDTSYGGGADREPPVERADVEYLLEPVVRHFNVSTLQPADCVTAWAGLRPLVAQPGKAPTEISRKDELLLGPAGVLTIAGGKLTGYRKMAEATVARVAEQLGRQLAEPGAEPPLPGGDFAGEVDALAARLAAQAHLDAAAADRLARLYGAEAEAVVARGREPLVPGATVLAGEVGHAVEIEAARTLEDLVYRRTRVALYDPSAREAIVEPAAARMAALLGWSPERTERERAALRARLAADLAFRSAGAAPDPVVERGARRLAEPGS
ncbi:MAG: glycerol-3-phosphate dehydrogenase/oxidase [Deltaproteobacteria bacterium]|nr:glycerol-3-phosphate dehydrogenase/oxidase [Deltaproteobacteria bacterium]